MSPLFQGRGTCSEHCCLLLKGYQQRKFSKVLPTQVSIWGQHQCPLISATESLTCWLSLLWLITQPVVFRGNNLALRTFMYVTQAGTGLALYRAIAPTKEETCLSRLETNNPCFPANVSCPSAVGSSSPDTCTDFWCPHKGDAPYPRARAHYPATSMHTSFFPFASPG